MRTEPDLDRDRLAEELVERYGLAVERLDFIPKGIDSWSYAAVLDDGTRRFVKLRRPTPDGEMAAGTGSELPLLVALGDLGRVRVPRPIPDRQGRLEDRLGAFRLSVFAFLDGHTLSDETVWPDDLYASVASAVAGIHASTDSVRGLIPAVEQFDLPFVADLGRRAAEVKAGARVGADLDDVLVPEAAGILAAIERVQELRDVARSRVAPAVLCHTDLWGANLLLTPDGHGLCVLDWDGARLAPPEGDLFMFAGTGFYPAERFSWFLDRYLTEIDDVRLDAEVIGFYLYRRNLEDLADFVASLARSDTVAMERTEMLGHVRALLDEGPHLEDRISAVRDVLARAGIQPGGDQ